VLNKKYYNDTDVEVPLTEEEAKLYKKQRSKYGKKNFNDNAYIDLERLLTPEDFELHKEYKKVTGKNYDRKKAWDLLQIIKDKDLKLWAEAKEGNIKSRNYLWTKHMLAIKKMLDDSFNFDPLEFNDRLNDCFFIFLIAIEEYNPAKNDNFLRFLKMFLPKRMINLLKRDSKHKKVTFEPIYDYDDSGFGGENVTVPEVLQVHDEYKV